MSEILIKNHILNKLPNLTGNLKICFKLIGEEVFEGVSCIVLANLSETPSTNFPKSFWEEVMKGFKVSGVYIPNQNNYLPTIYLFADVIYQGIPFPLNITPMPLLKMLKVLSHEVGHHLVEVGKLKVPINEDEENVVEAFANEIQSSVFKKTKYKFWHKCLIELGAWHLAFAQADYRLGNLKSAKDHAYTACLLNSKDEIAAELYWQIKTD